MYNHLNQEFSFISKYIVPFVLLVSLLDDLFSVDCSVLFKLGIILVVCLLRIVFIIISFLFHSG